MKSFVSVVAVFITCVFSAADASGQQRVVCQDGVCRVVNTPVLNSFAAGQRVVCQDGVCRVVNTPVLNTVAAGKQMVARTIDAVTPDPVVYWYVEPSSVVSSEAVVSSEVVSYTYEVTESVTEEVPVMLYNMQTREIRPMRAAIRNAFTQWAEWRKSRPRLFRWFRR